MADKKFTINQLTPRPASYTITGTDLLMATIGTETPFLSSIKLNISTLSTHINDTLTVWTSAGIGANSRIYRLDGKVGIGTANPTETLTVVGNISASGGISAGSGTFVYDDITKRVGIGTSTPTDTLTVAGNISAQSTMYAGDLPTADPSIAGAIWRSGNDLKISTG